MAEENKREREAAEEQERKISAGAGTGAPGGDPVQTLFDSLFSGGEVDPMALFQMAFGGSSPLSFTGQGAVQNEPGMAPGAARQIGEFGGIPLAQADVRTPFMRSLEMASAPALFQSLLNPSGAASMLGGTPLGQGGGAGPGGGLLSMLLGGGQMSGADAAAGPMPGAGANAGDGAATPGGLFSGLLSGITDNSGEPFFGEQQADVNFAAGGGQLQNEDINIVGEQGPEAVVGNEVIPLDGQQDPQILAQILQAVLSGSADFLQQGGPLEEAPLDGGAGLNMDAVNAITGAAPSAQAEQSSVQTGVETAQGTGGGGANSFVDGNSGVPEGLEVSMDNGVPVLNRTNGGNQGNQPGQPPVGGQQTQFNSGNQAAGGAGMIQRLLEQNPEQQAFGTAQNILTGQDGLLARDPGAGVIGAMQPVFEQNLQSGLRELTNQVPSVFNSGAAIAGTDLTRQALNDFNLQAAQAAQTGVGQQLQGLGALGGLAGQAGMNPFQRALGAGQFGLAAQNQAFQQQVGPAMQLLLASLQQSSPTAFQTLALGQN